jgi:uncharacterized protein YndB with AHSA1/START domain
MDDRITRALGAVTRAVETREHLGRPVRAVRLSREYPTDAGDLWDALTTPERIARWFAPVSADPRLGGRYQIEGNAGGEITRCVPPRELDLTWEFGGQTSWVELRLGDLGPEQARLELVHLAPSDEHWDRFGPGAVGVGWDLTLYGLGRHLETGGSVTRPEGLSWMASPDGKAFMRHSSSAWCDADIAGGSAASTARAAAQRTSAAYAGEPAPGASDG